MTEFTKIELLLESLGGEKRMNYALEGFQAALDSVGNPERTVKTIIIGGTNGKGSTTLLISQALKAAGHCVATYLSPHLQSAQERILLNLSPIPEGLLLTLAQEFEGTAKAYALTYFEYLTLLFFIYANRSHADFSVLEVGVGGRLDSTNVTDPIATVLTNVSWDHQALLGNSLKEILGEKLGILRKESLFFTGVDDKELRHIIEARCEELDAVYYYSKEIKTEVHSVNWEGQEVSLNGYRFSLKNPTPGALANAALAFLTLRITFPAIPISILQESFRVTTTPGRFETVSYHPRVVLSGDHNPEGVECLKKGLSSVAEGNIFTVCAFSPDKPYQQMFKELKNISSDILLTQISRLKEKTTSDYQGMGTFEPEATAAVTKMLAKMGPNDTLLITGSLYLVGELRKLWKDKVTF